MVDEFRAPELNVTLHVIKLPMALEMVNALDTMSCDDPMNHLKNNWRGLENRGTELGQIPITIR